MAINYIGDGLRDAFDPYVIHTELADRVAYYRWRLRARSEHFLVRTASPSPPQRIILVKFIIMADLCIILGG